MLFLRSYSCEFLSKCIREKKQHLLYFMLNRFLIHAKFSSLTSNAQSNVQSIMVSSIFASFAQLNIRWDWDHFVRIFVYFFFCYTFCCFICVSLSRCFCPLFFLAIKRFYVWQKMKWKIALHHQTSPENVERKNPLAHNHRNEKKWSQTVDIIIHLAEHILQPLQFSHRNDGLRRLTDMSHVWQLQRERIAFAPAK